MAQHKQPKQQPENQQPDQTTRSLYQPGEGPTSIQGVEASEFPDQGRGTPETSPGKELGRKIPSHTGAPPGSGTDVGLRATPDVAEASDHGHRKHN